MTRRPGFNPYEVLGVDRDADPAQIKAAFRRAAKASHPDTRAAKAEAPGGARYSFATGGCAPEPGPGAPQARPDRSKPNPRHDEPSQGKNKAGKARAPGRAPAEPGKPEPAGAAPAGGPAQASQGEVGGNDPDPDADDAFAKVIQAQLILLDPVRRAKFDQTGTIDDHEPDNTRAAALQTIESFLGPLMDQFIQSDFDPAKDPRRHDLVAEFREHANAQRNAIEVAVRRMKRAKQFLTDMRKRFAGRDSARPIERGIDRRIAMADKVTTAASNDDQRWVLAIAIMEGYSFKFDPPSFDDLANEMQATYGVRYRTTT